MLELTKRITDPYEQNYVAALMLGISGRHMSQDQERLIKEALRMTNVVREIEQEAREEGRQEGRQDVARIMLSRGMDVAAVAEMTGLPLDAVRQLQARDTH